MLSPELQGKIYSLPVAEPYVWRLRLTAEEFNEIESTLLSIIRSALLTPTWAKTVIVYMAEWYKRCYEDGNSDALGLTTAELATVWQAAGIDIERYVYADGRGARRWRYSTYILGGLALRHELHRKDDGRFLRGLWTLMTGDDEAINSVSWRHRAVSVAASIRHRHSLYHFLHAIVDGAPPYCAAELSDTQGMVNTFLCTLRQARVASKFAVAWLVRYYNGTAQRALQLRLLPEIDGDDHHYLAFSHAETMGIPCPEHRRSLFITVRYHHHNTVVRDVDRRQPDLVFNNTGCLSRGFLVSGHQPWAVCTVPEEPFDSIAIIAHADDEAQEYELSRTAVDDYVQLWQVPGDDYLWTSQCLPQRPTAVVATSRWSLSLPTRDIAHVTMHGEQWQWAYIWSSVTLCDGTTEHVLYNRQGYYRVATRLYSSLIQYIDGGYIVWQEPIDDDSYEEQHLPLIFHKSDLMAWHYDSKDDDTTETAIAVEIESVEWKQGNSYVPWADDVAPGYGRVVVRVTVQGRHTVHDVCYLPCVSADSPLIRHLDTNEIEYATYDDSGVHVVRRHSLLSQDIIPTVSLNIGNAVIAVWQPTTVKVIVKDGTIIGALPQGQTLRIPYIYTSRVTVHDFSADGYVRYSGAALRSIYHPDYLGAHRRTNPGQVAMNAWANNKTWPATALDSRAPTWLYVCFGETPGAAPAEACQWLFWDYALGTAVTPRRWCTTLDKTGILFPDHRQERGLQLYYPVVNDRGTFDRRYDPVASFLVATEYEMYYFVFLPLRVLEVQDYVRRLYRPLLTLRGGVLLVQDRRGLHRFAQEFNIDWSELIDKEK